MKEDANNLAQIAVITPDRTKIQRIIIVIYHADLIQS